MFNKQDLGRSIMNHIFPYRLKEHYEETEGGSVDSKDLYCKFSVNGGDKSQAALGKYIKLLFPSLKNRKVQSNGKNIRAYEGIQEKKSEELHNGMYNNLYLKFSTIFM